MTRKKKHDDVDGKSAAAGSDHEAAQEAPTAGAVFDAPLDDAEAIARLIELNHERNECAVRWEHAKTEAQDAKKELDNASNAISLLIDQIDRQRSGVDAAQPVLATLTTDAAH
jgi:hypothetical protein